MGFFTWRNTKKIKKDVKTIRRQQQIEQRVEQGEQSFDRDVRMWQEAEKLPPEGKKEWDEVTRWFSSLSSVRQGMNLDKVRRSGPGSCSSTASRTNRGSCPTRRRGRSSLVRTCGRLRGAARGVRADAHRSTSTSTPSGSIRTSRARAAAAPVRAFDLHRRPSPTA